MKCKKGVKILLFVSLLASFLISSFGLCSDTYASKVITGGTYGYKINNNAGATGSWSGNPPQTFLSGALGTNKALTGYNVTGTLYNEFSGTYHTNIAKITSRLACSPYSATDGCSLTQTSTTSITGRSHNGNNLTGSCVAGSYDSDRYMDYTCTISADNYDYPETFSLTIGTTSVYNNRIAYSCGGTGCMSGGTLANVIIQSVTFDLTSTQDPNTALLQQQINQNNTIINQNNTTNNLLEEQNQQDQQDRDNIEEQAEETEQQGQDASDEANQQGQTLLEAFGSLITAIGNIHSTNCTIPNFSIYGLNFQNMDFCQFNVPNGLMALASIGMIFIFVPLGINLVKRMIAMYNEILGGK